MEVLDILDLSSEEKDSADCLILSRSAAVSPPDNTRSSGRDVVMKIEDLVPLSSAATDVDDAPHNKRKRGSRPEKKNEDHASRFLAAAAADAAARDAAAVAAYYKMINKPEKKKKHFITVGKKIPSGVLSTNSLKGIRFDMHKSLANKKVLLYGLPGYHIPVAHFNVDIYVEQSKQWWPFFEQRIKNPVLDFLKHADNLNKNGVDEIVFLDVIGNSLMFALKTLEIRKRHKYVTVIADYRNRYSHALGTGMDIPQEGMPPRSRRFILLVDNLKVKFARFESIDEKFTIPSDEEIIKAFDL